EGGSVFHFLMKARSLSFAEAVEDLGERYGIAVRYEAGGADRRPGEDLYRVLAAASAIFRELLRSSPGARPARDLVRRRGVTPEAEQEFLLGYGGGGRDLVEALARQGIDLDKAESAGLLFRREGGGRRERFRGRLMFPVADARGRVCGFGARAIGDAEPKYLNSPDSEIYRKSALLYGLYQALPAIRKDRTVVVVEGYMDLIGLWQKGIRNAVATCGTSLTESHARTLKRLADTVILFFDGDMAGKRSAVRAGGPLYAAGVSPMVLFPAKGLDPDDWAKEMTGPELAERLGKAAPLMEYIERGAAKKHDLSGIAGKLAYLQLMGKYLPWVTDPAEYRLYVQRVARAAGLPEETVLERLKGTRGAAAAPPAGLPAPAPSSSPEEELLLGLLAGDPSLVEWIARDGVADLVEGGEVRDAIALLSGRKAEDAAASLRSLLDETLPEALRKRISGQLLRTEMSVEEARRIYPEAVIALRIRAKRREESRLNAAIGAARDDEKAELLSRQISVRREREKLEQERRTRG
ncbi:MAG: DNA primase, partial [Deltaproteobacteria bacterium]